MKSWFVGVLSWYQGSIKLDGEELVKICSSSSMMEVSKLRHLAWLFTKVLFLQLLSMIAYLYKSNLQSLNIIYELSTLKQYEEFLYCLGRLLLWETRVLKGSKMQVSKQQFFKRIYTRLFAVAYMIDEFVGS
ncbi:uncharacterized protein [Euphorbia lathyris]|uniref:uncharacterized protein isoform X2 n=1 Tax=Euphorbia lathyris TaxID=212925 RepID=UPI0033133DC8